MGGWVPDRLADGAQALSEQLRERVGHSWEAAAPPGDASQEKPRPAVSTGDPSGRGKLSSRTERPRDFPPSDSCQKNAKTRHRSLG